MDEAKRKSLKLTLSKSLEASHITSSRDLKFDVLVEAIADRSDEDEAEVKELALEALQERGYS